MKFHQLFLEIDRFLFVYYNIRQWKNEATGNRRRETRRAGTLPSVFPRQEIVMDGQERIRQLIQVLPDWFAANARDLPWRKDREPYHVWLSEIMLQQTRVEAVKGYYARFLAAVPELPALAAADPELLHKLWEGLGYYSRVRNLQKAAQTVMAQFHGVFPHDYASIRALPGIGDYTAGAICSICFGQSGDVGHRGQKAGVVALHSLHAGLLEHDLREPDVVGLPIPPPGQIPGVCGKPVRQRREQVPQPLRIVHRSIIHSDH